MIGQWLCHWNIALLAVAQVIITFAFKIKEVAHINDSLGHFIYFFLYNCPKGVMSTTTNIYILTVFITLWHIYIRNMIQKYHRLDPWISWIQIYSFSISVLILMLPPAKCIFCNLDGTRVNNPQDQPCLISHTLCILACQGMSTMMLIHH